MIRSMKRSIVTLLTVAFISLAPPALADPPLTFHVSGDGVFNPANIGTPNGANAGVVLGDGSGLSAYIASGDDFVLGGVDLGALEYRCQNIGVSSFLRAMGARTPLVKKGTDTDFMIG